jgi:tetratricopeptide (TPR) repeat protein
LGAFVALLVFAFFSYPFSVLPFSIVFTFLLASGRWSEDEACPVQTSRRPILWAFTCLLLTAGCLWKQYPVYRAYRGWKTAQVYYYAGLYKDTAENYLSLYPYLNDQIRFLFEYAQSLSKSEQPEESNRILRRAVQISCDPMLYNIMGKNHQAMKQYDKAEACFIQSTRLVPSRLYPWYLLCKLYGEMGLKDKVQETAVLVRTKEPKVQSTAVREMREEVERLIKN